MTHVSALGRGAASGFAGILVWAAVSLLFLGVPDPRRAAVAGLAVAVAVAVATELASLR
ncbi:hypothetical protein [Haloplanus salilacus]|uniref:hypothetical protein n=1 Tax=Haloplanus salilacus TaxID=2949994 RepID=UPI0030CA7914